jgi:hypothetical protein
LIACCDQIIDKPGLREVLGVEAREGQKRGLERRVRDAHIGAAKPMVDLDWTWPRRLIVKTYFTSPAPCAVGRAGAAQLVSARYAFDS